MEKPNLPVNDQSYISQNPEAETIQRCPHDESFKYSIVSNNLIRDRSISPECRWLIIYLLSNKEGWKINVQQVINHLQPHTGRNAVYKLFDEAIQAGYIKREFITKTIDKKGSINCGVKYFVAETPKFKKCLRRSENRDTDDRDTENQEHNKYYTPKNDYKESSLKVPETKMEAKASDVDFSDSKSKKEKQELLPKVHELGEMILECMKAEKPDYIPKKNASFLNELDFILRLDKRDPQKVLDVLKWSVGDDFWSAKMFKPNPVKYLREKFDQLEQAMDKSSKSKKEGIENPEENRKLSQKVADAFNPIRCKERGCRIDVLNHHVEIVFASPQKAPLCLKYSEKGFKDQLHNILRKLNL